KIDRSFIQELGQDSDAEAITAAVINLGHCLGMEVVAEGVETIGQQTWLAHLGCDTGQGFLYSPAIPAAEVPMLPFAPGRRALLQLSAQTNRSSSDRPRVAAGDPLSARAAIAIETSTPINLQKASLR